MSRKTYIARSPAAEPRARHGWNVAPAKIYQPRPTTAARTNRTAKYGIAFESVRK